jgi:hypothetical protein
MSGIKSNESENNNESVSNSIWQYQRNGENKCENIMKAQYRKMKAKLLKTINNENNWQRRNGK